jgi:hypothetical protein
MTGNHRRDRGRLEPVPGPYDYDVLRASGEATVASLRDFIADVELAAARAGTDAGQLQVRVAVRHTGAIKDVWVRIPRRQARNGQDPGTAAPGSCP